jgi:hypothetical protein
VTAGAAPRRPGARLRTGASAALCLLPLGLPWGGGGHTLGAASPARVFLVLAAVALAVVGGRPPTAGARRLARLGIAAAGFALALALAARAVPAVACLATAIALAAPPAWRSPG